MWSHYSEGHQGVVIGVEINPAEYEVRPIEYDGPHWVGLNNFHNGAAIDVLTHKLDVWQYEAEERVFTRGKLFVDVTVHKIICGSRMSTQDKGFINELVEKINPDIEIINARTSSAYG